jgi:DNA repair protein RadA/Sms
MAKSRVVFTCQSCGAQSQKWLGRCPECGEWNSYVEETAAAPAGGEQARGWRPPAGRAGSAPVPFAEVGMQERVRIATGIDGLDRVLGGGLVPGSLVLIAGEPGAGKSTIMLQAAASLATQAPVLYVSGEESDAQVKMRGERLGLAPANLYMFNETELDRIIEEFERLKPGLMIVDSVQTTWSPRFSSAPGSVSQVRETAAQLLMLAKGSGTPVFLVGHVNKEGQVAGPKTMEHIVDAVLMLEGERFHSVRIARALKNRFGPVSELALFELRSDGMFEVENPSELLLAERIAGTPGSAVTATVEGTRPLLIEVQALVSPTAYGSGRRTAEGFDQNRLALLLAIIERRCGLAVGGSDVFINIVGGVRIDDPAVDLAVAVAIASSHLDKPLPSGGVFIGELGLGGEIRSVSAAELRQREAEAIGMSDLYLPAGSARKLTPGGDLRLHAFKTLGTLFESLFSIGG